MNARRVLPRLALLLLLAAAAGWAALHRDQVGARRSTMDELAAATIEADKVLVF